MIKKIKETSSESLESLEARLSAKSSKVHSDFVGKVLGIGHFAGSLLPAPVESEISPRQWIDVDGHSVVFCFDLFLPLYSWMSLPILPFIPVLTWFVVPCFLVSALASLRSAAKLRFSQSSGQWMQSQLLEMRLSQASAPGTIYLFGGYAMNWTPDLHIHTTCVLLHTIIDFLLPNCLSWFFLTIRLKLHGFVEHLQVMGCLKMPWALKPCTLSQTHANAHVPSLMSEDAYINVKQREEFKMPSRCFKMHWRTSC